MMYEEAYPLLACPRVINALTLANRQRPQQNVDKGAWHLHNPGYKQTKRRFTLWTMEEGLFQSSEFMVQLPWSDFLKLLVLKTLGPSPRVNWMWIKKNDYALESECADFFLNTCPKRAMLTEKSSLTILSSSLGLHLSSLLVKCVKDVACKSSHNKFYKKNEECNLYMFNVIYMWHVPCVLTTQNNIYSNWLNLMLSTPYLAQHWFSTLW